jgi:hypothetical protein
MTSVILAPRRPMRTLQKQKFFASFFQKSSTPSIGRPSWMKLVGIGCG